MNVVNGMTEGGGRNQMNAEMNRTENRIDAM
jgi:hypothetical protein